MLYKRTPLLDKEGLDAIANAIAGGVVSPIYFPGTNANAYVRSSVRGV